MSLLWGGPGFRNALDIGQQEEPLGADGRGDEAGSETLVDDALFAANGFVCRAAYRNTATTPGDDNGALSKQAIDQMGIADSFGL